jgi:hypothetical protein
MSNPPSPLSKSRLPYYFLEKSSSNESTRDRPSRTKSDFDWNFLNIPNFELRHEGYRQLRLPDTCSWLCDAKPFRDWRANTGPSILWCHGEAAIGKSVLLSVPSEAYAYGEINAYQLTHCRRLSRVDDKIADDGICVLLSGARQGSNCITNMRQPLETALPVYWLYSFIATKRFRHLEEGWIETIPGGALALL